MNLSFKERLVHILFGKPFRPARQFDQIAVVASHINNDDKWKGDRLTTGLKIALKLCVRVNINDRMNIDGRSA